MKSSRIFTVTGFLAVSLLWAYALDSNLPITLLIGMAIGIIYSSTAKSIFKLLRLRKDENAYVIGYILGRVLVFLVVVGIVIWVIRITFIQ